MYDTGETVSVTVTIANRGNRTGTVRAVLGVQDPSDSREYPDRQSIEIPEGERERVTLTYTLPSDAPTGTYDATVDLRTPPGEHLFDTTGYEKSFEVQEPSGPGSVTGTVTDDDGDPIDGAKVYLDDRTDTRTGPDGSYEFASVEAGTHTVEVVSSGYESASERVSVTSDRTTKQEFELTPETFTVRLGSAPIEVETRGEGTYDYGASVSVSAPASADGYEFQHWEDQDGKVVSEDSDFAVDFITTDYDITAQYKRPGEPDLSLSAVSWEPSGLSAGDSATFYATVVNRGEARAATFDTKVSIDENDTRRILENEDRSLEPGESRRIELGTWTAKPGPEEVTATVDPEDDVDEADESNNELTESISVNGRRPDLAVTDIELDPTAPERGESTGFRLTIVNTGTATVETVESEVSVGSDLAAVPPTVTLEPGESTTTPWTGSYEFDSGSNEITATVDPDDRLQEENEDNNTRTRTYNLAEPTAFEDLSFDITRVNGNTRNGGVVTVEDAFVRTLTVEATDQTGSPVSNLSLELANGINPTGGISVAEVEPGSYQFSGSPALGSGMTVHEYNISLRDADSQRPLELPVRDPELSVPGPIEGWAATSQLPVSVDGERYTAVYMYSYRSGSVGESYGWVIYDADGRLVTDSEIQREAGRTAAVTRLTRDEGTWETFFAEEFPRYVDRYLGADYLLQTAIAFRDASAYTLGTLTMTAQTGGLGAAKVGGQTVAKLSTREAVKTTSRTVLKEALKNLATQYTADQVRQNPKAAMDSTIRETARSQLRQSRADSQEAARILRDHPDDAVWADRDAAVVWTMMNESLVEANLWMALRANNAPGGPVWEQSDAVLAEFASGYSGVPVSSLYDLANSFREQSALSIQESLSETAGVRQSFHRDYSAFAVIGPELTSEIERTYGTESAATREAAGSKRAAIEILDAPSGEYTVDETVRTTVRVRNTGDEAGRFFAGYSVGAPVQGELRYYDNRGRTGQFVTLDAGENEQVTLEWPAQESAPTDASYNVVVAAWAAFPSPDSARLDEQRRRDAFVLTTGGEVTVTGAAAPEEGNTDEPVPVAIDVRNTGVTTDETLVQIREDGEVVRSELVAVESESARTTSVNVSFSEPGTHELNVSGESATVRIAAPDSGGPAANDAGAETSNRTAPANGTGASDKPVAANESETPANPANETGQAPANPDQSDAPKETTPPPSEGDGAGDGPEMGPFNQTDQTNQPGASDESETGSLSVTATGSQTIDGTNVSLGFEVTNTGDEPEGVLLTVGSAVSELPGAWEIVNRTDRGGVWRESRGTLLFQSVAPGETVAPSVTISPPENATGNYSQTVEATTNDTSASARVEFTVRERSLQAAVDRNDNGEIDDGEILDAIDWWRADETVPDTEMRISNRQILRLTDLWQEGGSYR